MFPRGALAITDARCGGAGGRYDREGTGQRRRREMVGRGGIEKTKSKGGGRGIEGR